MSKPTGDDRPHYGNENGTMALGTDDSPPVVAIACEVLPTPFSSPCRTRARAQAQSLPEVHLAGPPRRLIARPEAAGRVGLQRVVSTHSIMPRVLTGHDRTTGNMSENSFLGRTIHRSN
jgi:hypothetical protein